MGAKANKREIRQKTGQNIHEGAVTPNYQANRETVIRLLNQALATEMVCVLRYKSHYFAASGMESISIAEEFWQHAQEEQQHADRIAERIRQLGGKPELNPETLATLSHSLFEESESLVTMIEQDLHAERIAIESYREIIREVGNDDPTTRRLMEDVLAKEEEHAEELASLLTEESRPARHLKLHHG